MGEGCGHGVVGALHGDDRVGADLSELLATCGIGGIRQRNEERTLLLPGVIGDLLRGAVHAAVGDSVEPEADLVVEVFERLEFAAAEEVSLEVPENSLVFSFSVGVSRFAEIGLIAVAGGEFPEAWMPQGFAVLSDGAEHHGGHAVIDTAFRDAFEIGKGMRVRLEEGGFIVTHVEADMHLSAIAEGGAEGMHRALLSAEQDAIRRPIELGLLTRCGLEASPHALLGRRRDSVLSDEVRQDGPPAGVALRPYLPQDAGDGQVLVYRDDCTAQRL